MDIPNEDKENSPGKAGGRPTPQTSKIMSEITAFPESHETSEETCQGIRKYVLDKTSLKNPLTFLDNDMSIW